jgi:hypothetical protein
MFVSNITGVYQMDHNKFKKFCKDKRISSELAIAFFHYLKAKYEENIPSRLNLELEYRQFVKEATSRL